MELLKFSASASVFILAVMLCRSAFGKRLPKITFRILWLVILIKLLVPVSAPSPLSVYNLFERDTNLNSDKSYKSENTDNSNTVAEPPMQRRDVPAIAINETPQNAKNTAIIVPYADTGAATNKTETGGKTNKFSFVDYIYLLLPIGGTAVFTIAVVAHFRHRRIYATSLPCEEKVISDWAENHTLFRKYSVRTLDAISSPLTYGILKPVILLPSNLNFKDESQIDFILNHEFVHIKRFDVLWKLLFLVALAVHWFNPLVWVAFVMMNKDIEFSCDEEVVKRMGGDCKSRYAELLVDLTQKRRAPFLMLNAFSINSTKERVRYIMKFKKTTLMGAIASAAVVILTVTIFATAPSPPTERQEDAEVVLAPETETETQATAPDELEKVIKEVEETVEPLLEETFGEGGYSLSVNANPDEETVIIRNADGYVVWFGDPMTAIPLGESRIIEGYIGTVMVANNSDSEFICPIPETTLFVDILIPSLLEDEWLTGSIPKLKEGATRKVTEMKEAFYISQDTGIGHMAIDFVAAPNSEIFAAADGKVILSKYDDERYGYTVMIEHENGLRTFYASCNELLVEEGEQVAQGQQIAKVGSTGRSTGPHLHFEVRNGDDTLLNPLDYLKNYSKPVTMEFTPVEGLEAGNVRSIEEVNTND